MGLKRETTLAFGVEIVGAIVSSDSTEEFVVYNVFVRLALDSTTLK